MMGRGSEANGTVATTTSWACRAAASVSPTEAYSGSVKLPMGLTSVGREVVVPNTALLAAVQPVAHGLVDDHDTANGIARREDVRSRCAQPTVDLDVAALIGPHAGSLEVQLRRRCHPSRGDHCDRRFVTVRRTRA